MWGNITRVVGTTLEKVQSVAIDIESQLDAAVGKETRPPSLAAPSAIALGEFRRFDNESTVPLSITSDVELNNNVQVNDEVASCSAEMKTRAQSTVSTLSAELEVPATIGLSDDGDEDDVPQTKIDIDGERNVIAVVADDRAEVDVKSRLLKLEEVVAERERALASLNAALSESLVQNETYHATIKDLQAELITKDERIRGMSAGPESDARKHAQRLQEALKEKDDRLASYEAEGQNLARKQSEMEKLIRKLKSESKEKDVEIGKLKESKEQLVKVIEDLQDQLRKHEQDVNNANKNLSAIQAVSLASTEKLTKLESEITTKIEEISSLKRALETSWGEVNEHKKLVAELRADRDDLRKQLGEGNSKVQETESSRRDMEQREAILRATNKQLQENLQRHMQEASFREERLREEIAELRKRWQDGVTSRETLAAELSNATSPLLKQITSLQENLRQKTELLQSVEGSLSERVVRAESACASAERRKIELEEESANLRRDLSAHQKRCLDLQSSLSAIDESCRVLRNEEAMLRADLLRAGESLADEAEKRQLTELKLRETEAAHRRVLDDSQRQLVLTRQQHDEALAKLKSDLESWKTLAPRRSADDDLEPSSRLASVNVQFFSKSILPSGEPSFAVNERLQQQLKGKSAEASSLQLQLKQLQASRDALLQEVDFLSSQSSRLEEQLKSLPSLTQQLTSLQRQNDALLALLGEKEEELEDALVDLRDVKNLYRNELDSLLLKLTASPRVHAPP